MMSKEYLEALGKNIRYKKEYVGNDTYRLYIKKNDIELLEKYLTELEQIDNANPNEALVKLDSIALWSNDLDDAGCYKFAEEYDTIKRALIKAQEQEKVLSIIKEKNVDIFRFKKLDFNTFSQLQKSCRLPELTQEEFDLLKEWLG